VIHTVLNQWLLEEKKLKQRFVSRSTNLNRCMSSGRAVSVFDK